MCKSSIFILQIILIFLTLLGGISAWAVAPYVNYQGKLTDSHGNPINNPAMDMTFSIWFDPVSEDIADNIFQETQTVEVVNGIYNVQLGINSGGLGDPINFSNNYELWLEVTVNGETLSPRTPITSVPAALWADKAGDAYTLAGMEATEFVATSNYILHTAEPSAHHAKYTDSEAVSSMGIKANTNPLNHDKTTSFAELTDQAADAQIPLTIIRESDLISHSLSPSVHHARYSDNDAVAAIKAADGAGSTLDADLLDGQHASEIIDAATDETRTAISALPFTITSLGSYYLTGNLSVSDTGANGITVNSDNVTIDLMGFTISGPVSGTGSGIRMNGATNVVIKNGTIRNFGDIGILEDVDSGSPTGKGHQIINITVSGNRFGIYLMGSGFLVKNCSALNNDVYGIRVSGGGLIIGNIANNNETGIYATGCTIKNNATSNNTSVGIQAGGSSLLGNVSFENQVVGIGVANSLVDGNTAYGNGTTNISYGSGNILGLNKD